MRLAKMFHFCPYCHNEIEPRIKENKIGSLLFILIIIIVVYFLEIKVAVQVLIPVILLFSFYFSSNKELVKGKRKYDEKTKSYTE